MVPQIVHACAAASIGETIVSVLKLVLITSGVGVVFVTPVLFLIMFFIRRYRSRGILWMVKQSVLIPVIAGGVLSVGFFTYLYLDIYVFTERAIPGSDEEGGVRLVHPLCG